MQRRAFPTTIQTVEKRAPTEAELDRILFEMVKKWCGAGAAEADPEPAIPTETELRQQARELGLPVSPPRRGSAEYFRDDMLRLLG